MNVIRKEDPASPAAAREGEPGARLLELIQEIANGHYSDDIMGLTRADVPEPIRTIAEAMGMMMVKVEAREYRLEQLVAQLRELNERIKRDAIATVTAMAHALAARDAYTEGHAARVGALATAMAQHMGLSPEEAEYVHLGGVLHDIGKIGFSDPLFNPHGGKNPPDLVAEIIKHPTLGAEILAGLDFLGPALSYIRTHHERLDGSGYPKRLRGEDIPLGAQILAVADGFDAMTTDRPYQKGRRPGEALVELRRQCPHRLNPAVVEALARLLAEEGRL